MAAIKMVYLGDKNSPFRINLVPSFQKYAHLVFETDEIDVFRGLLEKRMQDIDIFLFDETGFMSQEEKEEILEVILEVEAKKEKCLIFVIYKRNEDHQKYVKSLKAKTYMANSRKLTHEVIKHSISEYMGVSVEELERMKREVKLPKKLVEKKEQEDEDVSAREQTSERKLRLPLDEEENNETIESEEVSNQSVQSTEEAKKSQETGIHRLSIPEHEEQEKEQEPDEYDLNYANVYDMKEMTYYEIRGKDLTPEQKRRIKQLVRQRINRNSSDFVQYRDHSVNVCKRKNVAIINLFHRSGASFLMYNLAVAVANEFQVPVIGVEAIQPKPRLYHALKIQPSDDWQCPYDTVLKKQALYSHHLYEKFGVKWLAQAPHSLVEDRHQKVMLDHEELVYLYMMACEYPIVLTDVSSAFDCGFTHQVVLDMADEVWIVVNNDLVDMSYAYNKIQHYKKYIPHDNFFCIVNFHHNNVKTNTYVKYLGHVPLTVIPYDEDVAIRAQQNPFVYQYPELGTRLLPAFEPLFERLIKPEAIKVYKQNKKRHLIERLLNLGR